MSVQKVSDVLYVSTFLNNTGDCDKILWFKIQREFVLNRKLSAQGRKVEQDMLVHLGITMILVKHFP